MAGGEGSAFGKFFLIKRIASGGMGEVYLAKLKGPVGGFEKLLVIKRMLHHHSENREYVDMFFAEARVAGQLSHANVVQIYEMGAIEGSYFIAMEYVQGKSLHDLIDYARRHNERIAPAHVVEVISRLCDGLSYAHGARDMAGNPLRIIHRDINPHNVLLSYAGEVKIIDFGIAKSEAQAHQTETGTIKGKFVYMSPEQSAAKSIDQRSDIFSVGICLYEALAGRNPFVRNNVVASLDAIHRDTPPPLAEVDPALAIFDPIVTRALAKSAEERYADCLDLRDALVALRASVPVPARSLAQTMAAAFAEEITYERQMILGSDKLDAEQLAQMHQFAEEEHRSAVAQRRASSDRLRAEAARKSSPRLLLPPAREPIDRLQETDRAYSSNRLLVAHAPAGAAHSRLPFGLALGVVVMLSATAAAAVFKLVELRRLGLPVSSVTALWAPRVAEVARPKPAVEPPAPTPAPPPAPVANQPAAGEEPRVASPDDEVRQSEPTSEPRPDSKEPRKASQPERVATVRSSPHPLPKTSSAAAHKPTPTPAAEPGFGTLQVATTPAVPVLLNGAGAHKSGRLKAAAGKLVIGSGKSPESDPFTVTIVYKVEGDAIHYEIDAEPWAIVLGKGGIGLGRTPVTQAVSPGTSVFELKNPKDKLQLRINLRYAH